MRSIVTSSVVSTRASLADTAIITATSASCGVIVSAKFVTAHALSRLTADIIDAGRDRQYLAAFRKEDEMTDLRDAAMQSKAWPFEEARRVLKRYEKAPPEKGHVLFETGYGPSGLPHIGTFGEVMRTTMVRRAFELISDIPTQAALLFGRHGRAAEGARPTSRTRSRCARTCTCR